MAVAFVSVASLRFLAALGAAAGGEDGNRGNARHVLGRAGD
jgi:hypothetical protein